MGLVGNFILECFLSKYAGFFYKLSEKLKWKQLLYRTPQGLFLSWHGRPLPSSLPHDSAASPGSGGGRQLPVRGQSQRTCKPSVSVGKPNPLLSSPHGDLAASQLYHLAMSLGGGIKPRVASPSLVAKWERGSCLFLSSHRCCF